jgi:hypothetical protein
MKRTTKTAGSNAESTEKESFDQAEQLKKVLDYIILRKMLNGRQGAFSLRYWFIKEYMNYVNLLGSDPSLAIHAKKLKKTIAAPRGFQENPVRRYRLDIGPKVRFRLE